MDLKTTTCAKKKKNTECEDDDNDVYYDDEDNTPLSILRDMYHLFKEDDTDEESDGF